MDQALRILRENLGRTLTLVDAEGAAMGMTDTYTITGGALHISFEVVSSGVADRVFAEDRHIISLNTQASAEVGQTVEITTRLVGE